MLKRLALLLLCTSTLVLSAFLYVKIGPYRTIWGIHESIKVGDYNKLKEYIDFSSVRIDLKKQLEKVLTEMSLSEFDDPIKFLILSGMSKSISDGIVERFIEPENIITWGSSMIDSSDIVRNEDHDSESLFSHLIKLPSYLKKINSVFALKYKSSEICEGIIIDDNTLIGGTIIIFQRNGIDWQISSIEFSREFLLNKIK